MIKVRYDIEIKRVVDIQLILAYFASFDHRLFIIYSKCLLSIKKMEIVIKFGVHSPISLDTKSLTHFAHIIVVRGSICNVSKSYISGE